MNYIKIDSDNLLNGPGIRTVLWLAGCEHKCKNCHQMYSWDPDYGKKFDEEAKEKIFHLLSKTYCSGLTLTGGDPLFSKNREELASFLNQVKSVFPDKNIWCWTGYTIESLIPEVFSGNDNIQYSYELDILKNIDVLIDGPFRYDIREEDLKQSNSNEILKYRGSSNQRVIDIQKTLNERQVVLWQSQAHIQ